MNEVQILLQVALAAGLGALLGLEREVADKPAGLRTHMLVAGAACLVVLVGDELLDQAGGGGDPNRALHALITGIGFIGAGTILRDRGEMKVEGLTTAATLLVAAVIGTAVAAELWLASIGGTVLFVVVSWGLGRVVGWLDERRARRPGSSG